MVSIWSKLTTAYRRGVVSRVDGTKKCQLVSGELNKDDEEEAIEHVQAYGWSSKPLPGAGWHVLNVAADGSHSVCLMIEDRRFRPTDQEDGEVMIHNDKGDFIRLLTDGTIEVRSSSTVKVDTGEIQLTASGNVIVDAAGIELGAGATEPAVLGTAWQTYNNAHTHGSAMGPTSPPIVPSTPAELATVTKVK